MVLLPSDSACLFGMHKARSLRWIDADGGGTISSEEFEQGVETAEVQALMRDLSLDVKDAQMFFSMLVAVSNDTMVDGLPREWHHMRPVSCFCVSSLSGWLGWGWVAQGVLGWVVSRGSELSFLVENPRRLRTNVGASGGSLRDLCPNSRRFVALSVCLCLPNLAAGGFYKKSIP